MTPSHRALRAATAEAHGRVDTVFGGFDLGNRTGYAAFLTAHAEALLPWEASLDAASTQQVVADWPTRRRASLILDDLAILGRAPATDSAWTARIRDRTQSHAALLIDAPTIAGALYVLEGSRLGGKFLARSVPEGFPCRYLNADQPKGNWAILLETLDARLDAPAALQSATATALQVFDSFERAGRACLTKESHCPS